MSREASSDTPFVDFAAGSTILHQGEAAGVLYIIEAGKVAIERPGAPGTALAELGPGELFGEAALLHEALHATNAVARTAVRALCIDAPALQAVIRENADVAVHMLRRLAQRLRASEERIGAAPAGAGEAPPAAAPEPATAPKPAPKAAKAKSTDRADAAPPPQTAAVEAPVTADPPAPAPAPAPPVPEPPKPAVEAGPAVVPAVAPIPVASPTFVLRHAEGSIPLPEGKADCLVGRPDPATGAIPEINLGPLDLARSLSRRHARLLVEGGAVVLREEPGVANGTWVNGEKVAPGQGIALKPGDKLRFGAIELEFGIG